MNIYLLTFLAAASNIGTIICIKKCKHAVLSGDPMAAWLLGIALSIVFTQYLLLWADVKGASLGLAIAFVVAFVMVTAAFLDVERDTGRLVMISLKGVPVLQICGYALAILGVLLVGISQHRQASGKDDGPHVKRSHPSRTTE